MKKERGGGVLIIPGYMKKTGLFIELIHYISLLKVKVKSIVLQDLLVGCGLKIFRANLVNTEKYCLHITIKELTNLLFTEAPAENRIFTYGPRQNLALY
jgi:hypothetical protein